MFRKSSVIGGVWSSRRFHDNSSTDISSTTVYQRVRQLYIQLLFQQIIRSQHHWCTSYRGYVCYAADTWADALEALHNVAKTILLFQLFLAESQGIF